MVSGAVVAPATAPHPLTRRRARRRAGSARLLDGGLRRRRVRLRRPPLPRVDGRHQAQRAHGRDRPDDGPLGRRRQGLLDGGLRRRRVHLRLRAASTDRWARSSSTSPWSGIAADPATGGYWTVASDGGVFAFDAPFYGSMGAVKLNKPVVAMVATPDGHGYWLFASDGGVFAFGDAGYSGSLGNIALAAADRGRGRPRRRRVLDAGADGGVFAFGDAGYFGSLGGHALRHPLVGIAASDAGGYWMTDSQRGGHRLRRRRILRLGPPAHRGPGGRHGRRARDRRGAPTARTRRGPTAMTSRGSRTTPRRATRRCPRGTPIGIVQVTGESNGASNPCLAHEAQWAGGGLNLYIFMTYGTDTTDQPGCNGDPACNWGYEAGVFALRLRPGPGGEPAGHVVAGRRRRPIWSSNTGENDQVIRAPSTALRGDGHQQRRHLHEPSQRGTASPGTSNPRSRCGSPGTRATRRPTAPTPSPTRRRTATSFPPGACG